MHSFSNSTEIQSLNAAITHIRQSSNLTSLLTNLLDEICRLLGADGGVVILVGEDRQLIKHHSKGLTLITDTEKYTYHPIELIPKYCPIINQSKPYVIDNRISTTSSEAHSVLGDFYSPSPSSSLCIPILSQHNKVMGSISITDNEPDHFNESDLDLLQNISNVCSITIERLLAMDQYEKIQKITTLLFHDFSYVNLVESLRDIYEAYGCSIFIKKEIDQKPYLVLQATTGLLDITEDDYHAVRYEIGEGLTGYLASLGTTIRIYDVKSAAEMSSKAPGIYRSGPKYTESMYYGNKNTNVPESYLGTCLLSNGEVLGVIRLTKHLRGSYFTAFDEESLAILAKYIGARIRLDKQVAEIESAKELVFLHRQLKDFAHDAKHSHQLLSSYLYTIFDWIPGNIRLQEANKNFIKQTQDASELTKLYINKIATFSLTDSTLVLTRTSVKQLVTKIIQLMERRFYHKRIQSVVNIVDDLFFDVDEDKMEQVFINLLNNSLTAISSSRRTGKIEIRARQVNKSGVSYLCIEIEDDGPGIRNEDRERIFERGFSLTGGTGLGLAIAKYIVEAHRGKIVAKVPKTQKGALFAIEVPQIALKRRGK